MPVERRTIDVVANWVGLGEPVRMGRLHATPSRGKEIFSFEYDRAWLGSEPAFVVDPGLRLDRGPQHAPTGGDTFGVFLDSSPDRWGRVLLQRREAQRARTERRRERTLVESDYLLGVYDGHRLGGLRFRIDGGPFLDDNIELASTPWTSLLELEHASLQLERAPAYDMNPVTHGDGLTLNISETDNAQDLELVLDVAKHFRVKAARAKEIVGEVETAVAQWRAEARQAGILRAEQDRMASAFRVADGGA